MEKLKNKTFFLQWIKMTIMIKVRVSLILIIQDLENRLIRL